MNGVVREQSTHVGVVLAADSGGRAGATSSADDRDGRAGEANLSGHTLKNDAQKPERSQGSGTVGLECRQ